MNRESPSHRKKIEELITEISGLFDQPVMDVDISEAMKMIGENLGADRAYVFLIKKDGGKSSRRICKFNEWCSEDAYHGCNILLDVDTSELPWLIKKLSHNETLNYNIDEMPLEAISERSILQAQKVTSIAASPFFSENHRLIGFIAIDTINKKREWGAHDELLLKEFASIMEDYIKQRNKEIERKRVHRIVNCTWQKDKQ